MRVYDPYRFWSLVGAAILIAALVAILLVGWLA